MDPHSTPALRRLRTLGAALAAIAAGALAAPEVRAGGYEDLQRCAELTAPDQAEESLTVCTRAIESGELATRNLAIAHYNRGNAHRRLESYNAAAADFTKAIEIWPELDQAWNNRGGVYARLCRTDDALADFEKAMEIDPAWVRRYQQHLKDFGVEIGVVDGEYGPRTESGLRALIEAQCVES